MRAPRLMPGMTLGAHKCTIPRIQPCGELSQAAAHASDEARRPAANEDALCLSTAALHPWCSSSGSNTPTDSFGRCAPTSTAASRSPRSFCLLQARPRASNELADKPQPDAVWPSSAALHPLRSSSSFDHPADSSARCTPICAAASRSPAKALGLLQVLPPASDEASATRSQAAVEPARQRWCIPVPRAVARTAFDAGNDPRRS